MTQWAFILTYRKSKTRIVVLNAQLLEHALIANRHLKWFASFRVDKKVEIKNSQSRREPQYVRHNTPKIEIQFQPNAEKIEKLQPFDPESLRFVQLFWRQPFKITLPGKLCQRMDFFDAVIISHNLKLGINFWEFVTLLGAQSNCLSVSIVRIA